MANHIVNQLIILEVDQARLDQILHAIKYSATNQKADHAVRFAKDRVGSNSIDFKKIVPFPHIVTTCCASAQTTAQGIVGINWDNWRIKHWGTRCNSYQNFGTGNQIQFTTIVYTPELVIETLSQLFPDAQFSHQWADSDNIGFSVGHQIWQDGVIINRYHPSNCSASAYEQAATLLDINLKDCGFVYDRALSTYQYDKTQDQRISPP